MIKNFKFVSLVLTVIFCFSAIAFGQETTGSIEGTIKDPNDAIVPGIAVTIQSTGSTTGFNRTVTTDDNGYFIVSSLPVGNYKVTVTESKGFKGTSYDTTVVLGKASQANFKLEVGAGTTVVDVNSGDGAAVIDPTESKLTTNITKEVFDALPKGTTFTTLLKTAPNVRNEPLSGGFQVDGASGAENVYVIDGQEVTNFNTGTLNSNNNLPFELVQEVQIKSTGFEAEYGGATGGVINVVTAGGNDAWRGNFGISFDVAKFQGGARPILSRFSNASTATGQAANGYEYFNAAKLGGTNYYPVGRLSGPLVKEKLWLSATYAPQLTETIAKIPFFVNPTAFDAQGRNIPSADPANRILQTTQTFNYKFRVEEAFLRLDAQPTSKLRAYGTFLWNPIIEQGASIAYAGATLNPAFGLTNLSTVNPLGPLVSADEFFNTQGGRQNSNNINGQVTYTATNNLVLNFRVGRSFLNQKLQSYGIPNALRYVCSAQGTPQNVAGSSCNQGFSNFPSNFQNAFDTSYRNTIDADANLVGVNFGGRHNLKFGYQYNGISNTVNQGYQDTGIVVLFYGLGIDNFTGQTPTGGNLGSGYLQRFQTGGKASSANQGVFVQDSWQIASRLTLNLGLRAEVEDVPSFSEGNPGIKFGWGDKLAPRLGFAYDVLGDGKTKLFGSYGWFYDRFKYQLPRGSFGGDFFRRDWFEILPSRGASYNSYTRANILGTGFTDPIGGAGCEDTVPIVPNGYSVCNQDFRIPSNSGLGVDVSGAVDPNLKAARQSEYTFGVEHQLFNNLLISARFSHKKVDFAIEDIGLPNASGSEAYIIGNPGFGLACDVATDNGFQCTKAQRDYKAFEISVDKRLKDNWFFNASYTLSRLFGNYSGLASSDEAGRASPNVNRFFDLPFMGYTASGAPDNGLLATDRPHVFKAFGGYIFDWFNSKANTTDISFFTTIQSGTPLTTNWNFYNIASAVLFERGDLGRTETFTETDFSIKHTYKFGRDNRFSFQPFLNILNLFDEKNELGRQTLYNVSSFSASTLRRGGCPAAACADEFTAIQQIFNGGITQYILNDINANRAARLRNDYNLTNFYQAPRAVRFGARIFF